MREGALIGPYARLRPGADIGEDAHIGNFVEVKKVTVGKGAKANHLSYLGDGTVGAGANIGAGTIFCNYDGFDKYETHVGEGAFIGSNTRAGGAGDGRGGRLHRLRLGDHQGRAARRPGAWPRGRRSRSPAGRRAFREAMRRKKKAAKVANERAPTTRSGPPARPPPPWWRAAWWWAWAPARPPPGSSSALAARKLDIVRRADLARRPPTWPRAWACALGELGDGQGHRPDRRRRRRDRPGPVADQGRRRGPAAREAGLGGLAAAAWSSPTPPSR